MAKSRKNATSIEDRLALALTSGMAMNRQVVLSQERCLRRAFIALSKYQGNEDLCEDIKAVLDWVETMLAEEAKKRGEAVSKQAVIQGPEH